MYNTANNNNAYIYLSKIIISNTHNFIKSLHNHINNHYTQTMGEQVKSDAVVICFIER